MVIVTLYNIDIVKSSEHQIPEIATFTDYCVEKKNK